MPWAGLGGAAQLGSVQHLHAVWVCCRLPPTHARIHLAAPPTLCDACCMRRDLFLGFGQLELPTATTTAAAAASHPPTFSTSPGRMAFGLEQHQPGQRSDYILQELDWGRHIFGRLLRGAALGGACHHSAPLPNLAPQQVFAQMQQARAGRPFVISCCCKGYCTCSCVAASGAMQVSYIGGCALGYNPVSSIRGWGVGNSWFLVGASGEKRLAGAPFGRVPLRWILVHYPRG